MRLTGEGSLQDHCPLEGEVRAVVVLLPVEDGSTEVGELPPAAAHEGDAERTDGVDHASQSRQLLLTLTLLLFIIERLRSVVSGRRQVCIRINVSDGLSQYQH